MSKLKELIDRLCPNGVEYKPISEIAFIPKDRINIKRIPNGLYIGVENLLKDKAGMLPATDMPAVYDVIKFETNDILIGNIRPYLKKIWLANKGGGTNGDVLLLRLNSSAPILPKFFYYIVSSDSFFSFHNQYAKGAKMPRGDKQKVMEFLIPVPPIEVQEEIVKILDRFSDYAAELQARKEQYEYYRNLLLTFNPSACGCGTDGEQEIKLTTWGGHSYEIAWKTMGEIGKFIRGKRFVRTDIVEHGIPCIHYGDMYTHYGLYALETPGFINEEIAKKMRFAEKNDVVIVAAGENKEDLGNALAWLGDEPAAVHDACFIFKSEMYPNYLSHVCRTRNYHRQVRMFANEAKICSVSGADLSKVVIPLPPYELQVKIASILDRFETLVNDLTQGLPAEIAAVKEQYEYYRNKLLTFKKAI